MNKIFRTTEFIRCGGIENIKKWLNEQPKDFICIKIMHTTQNEIDNLKKEIKKEEKNE